MKNTIAKFFIYGTIIGLLLFELLFLFSGFSNSGDSDGFEIISIIIFMFLYLQLNVIVSTVLLIILIIRYRIKRTFSRHILVIHALYFAVIFIYSLGQVDHFRQLQHNFANNYEHYKLNFSWASHYNFLSNTYVILKLGLYEISSVFNATFNRIHTGDSDEEKMLLPFFANTVLSFAVLLTSLFVWFLGSKQIKEHVISGSIKPDP